MTAPTRRSAVYLDTMWSTKFDRRIHKIGIEGTSKYIIVSDDELADLIRSSHEVLNDNDHHQ